jgi:N-dimethylarginine dimethylaminohydrolase
MTGAAQAAKLATMRVGGQSEVGRLLSVAVKPVGDAFRSAGAVERQWRELGYTAPPELTAASAEYAAFLALLGAAGVEVLRLPQDESVGLDSLYARDASIVCDAGVILCSMGKPQRRTEPAAQEAALRAAGVPIRGRITGDGRLEGGDVCWIDGRTLAVGRGYRTNDAGIRQLRDLVAGCADEVMVVPLPHWRGPQDVFHLMSMVSPVDHDLFLVYAPLLPVPFREALLARRIELVEVPTSELETLGCNVLAIAKREVLMVAGKPTTRARLERAGVTVHEFAGRDICLKGGGGPTCLTRPLAREAT